MIIKRIEAGPLMANCYIIIDEETGKSIIMDPGGNADAISKEILNSNTEVQCILLTHSHFDHVGGVIELCKEYNISCFVSKVDYDYSIKDTTNIFGKLPSECKYIKDGDEIKLGNSTIKVLGTPGHTEGGLSFFVDNKVFTGDTLFRTSIGRTDFLGGNFDHIISSIKNKILPLGDDVLVFPGHGPESSVGNEKRNNPYLD